MAANKFSLRKIINEGEQIFHNLRWKYGIVVCPYCGSIHIKEYDGYTYKCNSCKNRFNDKTQTIMHGSKLSVGVWMQAVYEMVSDNFVSSITLANKLGINQKSAWLIQAKLRYAMNQERVQLEDNVIAQDEMYIGGCLTNYHYARKWDLLRKGHFIEGDEKRYSKQALFALNASLKQPVFGMTDGSKVVLYATPNPIKKEYIRSIYKKHTNGEKVVVSDESHLYVDWEKVTGSVLYTNNHHDNQYTTEGGLTSNAIENRFSWYKRGFNGRITHCKYHQLYLNEFAFRFNHRGLPTIDIFNSIVESTVGKCITYRDIREYNPYKVFMTEKQLKALDRKKKDDLEVVKFELATGMVASVECNHRIYTKEDFK